MSSARWHPSRRREERQSATVPRIIITHAIHEVDRRLAPKDERAAAMPGATGVTDLVAMDGSNQAAVTFETDGVDGLLAMLASMPPGSQPRRSRTE